MAWTYQDLYDEIEAEVDDNTSDAETVIKGFVNDVCEDIWQSSNWSFKYANTTISSVSGTRTYDLSSEVSDYAKILTIGYQGENDDYPTVKNEISFQSLATRYPDDDTTGTPILWSLYGDTLYFFPIPDYSGTNNITINYQKVFTRLSATTDVPAIPEKFRDVIKAGVKAKFWSYDDDTRSVEERNNYVNGLARMLIAESDRTLTPKRPRLFSA